MITSKNWRNNSWKMESLMNNYKSKHFFIQYEKEQYLQSDIRKTQC